MVIGSRATAEKCELPFLNLWLSTEKKKKAFVELKCENDDVIDASFLKEIEKSFKIHP